MTSITGKIDYSTGLAKRIQNELNSGNFDNALYLTDTFVFLFSGHQAATDELVESYTAAAQKLIDDGQLEQAEALISKALVVDPQNSHLLTILIEIKKAQHQVLRELGQETVDPEPIIMSKQVEVTFHTTEQQVKQLVRKNALIAEIGRIISSTSNIEEVYTLLSKNLRQLIPFDTIAVAFINRGEGTFTIPFFEGVSASERQPRATLPAAGTTIEKINQTRKGVLFQIEEGKDVIEDFPGLLPDVQSGVRSWLAVPLISGDQVIGVLILGSKIPGGYNDRDLRLAGDISNQIVVPISYALLLAENKKAEETIRTLQKHLREAEMTETIGRLAGGIAHDFNNILAVINTYAELSLLNLPEGAPLRKNIEGIKKAAKRGVSLTQQLLALGRRQISQFKVLNLNTLLLSFEEVLNRVIRKNIDLVIHLADDLGNVKMDPDQFKHMILNLVDNAKDAMPNGGKLIIETANAELDEEYARTHVGGKPGPYIQLSVSDTGVGIPPETREHVFEPFFTTKENRPGLGLSAVSAIVKQIGGYIEVHSDLTHGAVFKIYLPRIDEPVEVMEKRIEEVPHGKETILLVEDEDSLRKLAMEFLESLGYTVLEAQQGNDASLICKQYEGSIDLVVTDFMMPGMSGQELTEHLLSQRPGMKVLYMSGYTDDAIIHHAILEKGANYIQKPLSLLELTQKIREVLDKNSEPGA